LVGGLDCKREGDLPAEHDDVRPGRARQAATAQRFEAPGDRPRHGGVMRRRHGSGLGLLWQALPTWGFRRSP